jgi:hypothetical protein
MSANLEFNGQIAAHKSFKNKPDSGFARNPGFFAGDQGDFSVTQTRVTELDRWIAKKMMDVVGNPPIELRLWDGSPVTPPIDNPVATLQYNNRGAMLKTIINPELYFGDLYSSGQASFRGDLVRFSEIIYSNLEESGRGGWLRHLVLWLGHRRIANSHDKAKDNIYHHYDIGNEFYRLWLDNEAMQYTCAYFPEADMTLEQAQVAKLHHVCRKLRLKPGDSVVEAGCGWGGLALFMAKHYGVKVRAYNISKEQVAHAHCRAEAEGLAGQVEYVLDDYRNISGQYDAFVSVGMLEHVGKNDFPTARFNPLYRAQPAGADERLDRTPHISGRLSPEHQRNDADLRTQRPVGARYRKPAPALCEDPGTLARALPGKRGRGAGDDGPGIRQGLAVVPCRFDSGV